MPGPKVTATMGPHGVVNVLMYLLVENWCPPGVLRDTIAEVLRLRDDPGEEQRAIADGHIAAIADDLTRQLLGGDGGGDCERLHILVDFDAEDVDYERLVLGGMDEITDLAAQHVRSMLTERVKKHHADGTHPEAEVLGGPAPTKRCVMCEKDNPGDASFCCSCGTSLLARPPKR